MKRFLLPLSLCLTLGLSSFAQKKPNELHYTSSQQQLITIYKGNIFVNGNKTFVLPTDPIVYNSRRNKLIENGRTVFLFLEVEDKPNKNKMYVFNIDHSIADSVAYAIASDVKDYDHDGNMEFGGSEQTAVYPSADSMYYVASKFYEIKKGRITFDEELTEKTDTKVNGVYLKNATANTVVPKKKGQR
ncbi:hypothetical protein SAMN05660909_00268 [Chitinophaga terrae (ex Kim and Jung 2007)]|uniref:Uncharacterized protein n=1 Tax=Chitinophaga terrae (ex Kim and Jung 2007) TaxID=408074 RepID=A0A1H3X5Z7_9BACT|nr:hypothetical protein [Chitinophaga terrae (ex Kim and Jung 2007)]GEP89915.1 hypothetical protein CTE07_15600 [Chitinophaga terrae (ex Kim and Jung 2007)]SDZ94341.1 hypothetical protein SAMN05660909_00268 [Chitinophaga terrae (ex Kim and Jung 2007)]